MIFGGFLPIPHTDFEVLNNTNDILYITPVDTTPGRSVVIEQPLAFIRRDVPLQPDSSVAMVNYGEEHTLSGIAVCRAEADCRLATDSTFRYRSEPALPLQVYTLSFFEVLPGMEPGLLSAIQSHRRYSFDVVFGLAGILMPVVFLCWLYLVVRSRSSSGSPDDKLAG